MKAAPAPRLVSLDALRGMDMFWIVGGREAVLGLLTLAGLDGLKGVIGRGDKLVMCTDQFEPLVRHLLSNTWLVDSLETAYGLRKLSGAGLRFVTSAGELLENDGSTVVGPVAGMVGALVMLHVFRERMAML